jgi:hypothetical protein
VTITAIGIEASITSNNTTQTGITISAGASGVVTIRGLTLIAGASGGNGIFIASAKSVTIRDTSISGFSSAGILAVNLPFALDLELRDVAANNNGEGLGFAPNSGTGNATLLVTGSTFNGSTDSPGIVVQGANSRTVNATFADVTAANSAAGIFVSAGAAGPTVVMVTGSKLVNNGANGLSAQGSGLTMFVDRAQISGNVGMGWQATNRAVVKSYTNNEVNGNGDDTLNGVTQITSQ